MLTILGVSHVDKSSSKYEKNTVSNLTPSIVCLRIPNKLRQADVQLSADRRRHVTALIEKNVCSLKLITSPTQVVGIFSPCEASKLNIVHLLTVPKDWPIYFLGRRHSDIDKYLKNNGYSQSIVLHVAAMDTVLEIKVAPIARKSPYGEPHAKGAKAVCVCVCLCALLYASSHNRRFTIREKEKKESTHPGMFSRLHPLLLYPLEVRTMEVHLLRN